MICAKCSTAAPVYDGVKGTGSIVRQEGSSVLSFYVTTLLLSSSLFNDKSHLHLLVPREKNFIP